MTISPAHNPEQIDPSRWEIAFDTETVAVLARIFSRRELDKLIKGLIVWRDMLPSDGAEDYGATPSPAQQSDACASCNQRPCHSLTGLCVDCLYPERAKRVTDVLQPFAAKADKWEANHNYHGSDSTQIQHRLGDFRAARAFLKELGDEG